MWEELKKDKQSENSEEKKENKLQKIEEWLKEKEEMKNICMLIYGSDGTGKSGLAMDYPLKNDEKMIYLDLDGGANPLFNTYHKNKQIILRDPTVINEDTLEIDYRETIARILGTVEWIKQNYKKENIKVFIFDGASTLLKIAENVMRLDINRDVSEGVEMRFWKVRNRIFTEVVSAIKSVPVDVIFIAHEDFILNDNEGAAPRQRLNQMAFQKVRTERIIENNIVKYKYTVDKSKYNVKLENKQDDFLVVIKKADGVEYKWKGQEFWEMFL